MGRCDVESGCQYGTECSVATCAPTDACEIASCAGDTCTRAPRCPGQLCCGGTCCTDDADPCTTTTCVANACTQVPNTAPCSDGDACTTGDACSGGTCRGTPITCAAAPACRTNTCVGGSCVAGNQADGTTCDRDANLCTLDACAAGVCAAGSIRSCNDLLPCTDDVCNATTGSCEYPASPAGSFCGGLFDPCNHLECDGGGLCVPAGCPDGLECCGSYCGLAGSCEPCRPPMICPEL